MLSEPPCDVTAYGARVHEERRHKEQETQFLRQAPPQMGATLLPANDDLPRFIERSDGTTGFTHIVLAPDSVGVDGDDNEDASAFDQTRDARLILLVRKHAGPASVEDNARLMMLSQRLEKLAPRVRPEDIADLDSVVSQLEEADAELTAISAKYDLP